MTVKLYPVLVALLLFVNDPAFGFEMDGHYYLNYVLAEEIGCFTKEESLLICTGPI
jgi:hypothetical protein